MKIRNRRGEGELVTTCLQLLALRRIFAWRANCAVAWLPGIGGKLRPVRFGMVGQADITGILPDGRRLEIECKLPGRRLTTSQEHFLATIRRCGGEAWVVHSIDELIRELDRIKERTVYGM